MGLGNAGKAGKSTLSAFGYQRSASVLFW